MKKQSILSAIFCILAASAVGCSSSGQDAASHPEHVSTAEQRLIAGVLPATFSMWPMGPIAFDGTVATMPIAIWSATPIGMLAFDVPGITGLTVSLGTLDATSAFVPLAGLSALPITTPFLSSIQAGLAPAITPLAFTGPALLPAATVAAPLLTPIAPLSTSFFTPTITNSALMFTNLPATAALTPFIVNVGFTWPSTLNLSALNVFAASADATAAFTSSTFTTAATTAAASSLAFNNMLFPLTFIGPVGTLPASIFW